MRGEKVPLRGSKYMSESNRSSGGTESLALTTAERAYLESGITGGYRQSTIESRIEEKTESLSARLNRLVEDIEILSESDQLREDTKTAAWENILMEASDASLQDSEGEITDLQPASAPSTPLTEFGKNIGNMIHHLLRNPSELEYPTIITQLVYGFYSGNLYQSSFSRGCGRVWYRRCRLTFP